MATFELVETESTALWDFGWFDRSIFRVVGSPHRETSRAILADFLRSTISRRSFCSSPDPWGEGGADGHGPFVGQRLSERAYQAISSSELNQEVRAILEDRKFDRPPGDDQQQHVWAWVASALNCECFALRRAVDGAGEGEWNFIWLVFQEFVCFTPDREHMTVAVIGYD